MTDLIQWQRDNPAGSGTGATDIAGAVGDSYTYTVSDTGHKVRARDSSDATVAVSSWSPIITNTVSSFGSALNSWLGTYFTGWTNGHLPSSSGRTVSVNSSATLQTALNNAVAGDTITLSSGTYTNISVSGKIISPSNPVTVRPATGATVHIQTSGTASHAWYMTNCQGFKFVDLVADLAAFCAFKLDTHVKDIEFNGCRMTGFGSVNTGHGVLTDYECERIAIWNCKTYNGGDHGLYIGSVGSPAGAAFGVKGLLIANHLSYDNFKGPGSASGNSAGFGIQLGDSVLHGRVVNSTCDHNGIGASFSGGMTLYTQGAVTGDKGTDVEFVNCLTTNNVGWGITCPGTAPNKATNIITYCLAAGNTAGAINGASMMTEVSPNYSGDPLYLNRTGKDFHPSTSGPAHGVGDATWTPAIDANGDLRTTPDLGALVSTPTLVWSDEFTGTSIDLTKWTVRNNDTTSNQEAEYLSRNATVANGVLTLRAVQESVAGKSYTSAYLDTIGKFSQQYGRWEMRAQLPQAQGLWPAFWLRGNAGLGELDIMEAVGGLPLMTVQTVHQSTNGDLAKAGHEDTLPSGTTADWHIYAVERHLGVMRWYVDDRLVFSKTVTDLSWMDSTFNEPMNIRLNLQVGGSMPTYYNKPVGTIPSGQGDFIIDYIRVYQ